MNIRDNKMLVFLISFVILISIGMLIWLGIAQQASLSEMYHIVNTDLQQMNNELANISGNIRHDTTLPLKIHDHARNNLKIGQMTFSIILFSAIFLVFSWGLTFIHWRKLKNIKASEKQLEEFLYYHQVSELHKNSHDSKVLSPDFRQFQLDRDRFMSALKHGLENNEFILHYQPIVSADSGNIVGVEALVRWQHPQYGLLLPEMFLPLCENTGFIIPLGEWVFKTARKQLNVLHRMGHSALFISINLSTLQLNDPGLLPMISGILTEYHLLRDKLQLELTENAFMKNIESSMETMQAIHHLGIKLSLDDFGTGYSSLQYLKRLPISNLKIDKMFIADMSTNITSFGIVESIITLGKSLGLTVTSEGIEHINQSQILKKMGCDLFQGFLYSKPVSSDELTRLLESSETDLSSRRDHSQYRYEVLRAKHHDQAVNVITQSFCEREPMIRYLGISSHEFLPFAKILVGKAIHDGLSMVALDNHKVVACTIVEDMENPLNLTADMDEKCKIIFTLFNTIGSEFLKERAMYKGHIAHLLITAVHGNYAFDALSRKINFESIHLAREKNFDFMCCEFTHDSDNVSHLKTRRLLIRSCQYRDFVHEGKQPFKNLEGSANAYIWELREGAKLRYKIHPSS